MNKALNLISKSLPVLSRGDSAMHVLNLMDELPGTLNRVIDEDDLPF